jgi:hypothetical protein
MKVSTSKLAAGLMAVLCSFQLVLPATAAHNYYNARVHRYYGHTTYMQRHPRVRAAAIGAAVGTAAGAATGLITRRGIARGALIGAGTGAGVGLVRSSPLMHRHPIVNDTATGGLVGLGLGLAGGRRHHHDGAAGAAVGAGVGLAAGLLRHAL